jgi:hypothetical protein
MFGLPLIPAVKRDMAPFNPSHSWLLGERPPGAFVFALAATAAFALASASYLARASWWPSAMIAAALSVVLLALFASKYFIVGFPISIALAVWAWQAQS